MTEFGIVTIVQCRYGSSRLKGKATRAISGRPMLAHVLERADAIGFPVVLATSKSKRDDAVAKLGSKAGAQVVRGDEQDVLGRMADAARTVNARIVVRVTGDCPLLAPDLAREVISLYIQAGHVIATNDTATSGWPDGLDVEVFQAADLYEADAAATKPDDREHVTRWLRRHVPHAILRGPTEPAPKRKLSVDTADDYEHVKAVHARLAAGEFGWRATFAAALAIEAEATAPKIAGMGVLSK